MERLTRFVAEAGPAGRTATDISRLFQKNRSREELRSMVEELAKAGQVEEIREATTGRPVTRFRWVGKDLDPMTVLLQKYELNDQTTNPGVETS